MWFYFKRQIKLFSSLPASFYKRKAAGFTYQKVLVLLALDLNQLSWKSWLVLGMKSDLYKNPLFSSWGLWSTELISACILVFMSVQGVNLTSSRWRHWKFPDVFLYVDSGRGWALSSPQLVCGRIECPASPFSLKPIFRENLGKLPRTSSEFSI